jgi:AraC family transcriptional regulator, regulatory protein of adaptative response / methylated-DNA-[protein]-cysteine methyltransferase
MDLGATFPDTFADDYERVAEAIHFLEIHFRSQPELKEVADHIGFSEYHFQRLFTRWVGISPKRFLQFLTKEFAMQRLRESESLLSVTYESGLSSPGRLHDLLVTCEAVTPGEYKRLGEGITIFYGFHPSPFGEVLLAATSRGVCDLMFVESRSREEVLVQLRLRWPRAELYESSQQTAPLVQQVFSLEINPEISLPVFLKGTNFQLKVWEALMRIPTGAVISYEDLAVSIGMPGAARAVGNAVGRNPIPVLIPCHRVIHADGSFGNYHYGAVRKKALLGWEFAQIERKQAVSQAG